MSQELEARVQELLDREAIRDCLYRYCRGIDRLDEQALRSAYWEDATDRHGAYQGPASGFIQHALEKPGVLFEGVLGNLCGDEPLWFGEHRQGRQLIGRAIEETRLRLARRAPSGF